jgi:autotransporter-associated beta strand protein
VNGCWAEVGALNIDCGFGGHYSRGYRDASHPYINHIRKVGTAKLTLTLSRPVGDIEIKGGILDIGSKNSVPLYYSADNQHYLKFLGDGATLVVSGTETVDATTTFVDPSARIAYSTSPICFSNAVDEVHVWSTALANSNTGGLVKKGEGTLVLKEVPLYMGDTYLDGGTLKIPASAGVRVKTHDADMRVQKSSETIDEVEYTVYRLIEIKPGTVIRLI